MSGAAALCHLTPAGACRRAPAVIDVVTSPDDRGVADPPRKLPGPTRRAHAAGEVAGGIAGDDVDRAMSVVRALRIPAQSAGKLLHLFPIGVRGPCFGEG